MKYFHSLPIGSRKIERKWYDKDAAWIWEASFLAVGQQLIQSVCEELRNRHIYQDSLQFNQPRRKEKTEMGNFRKQSTHAQIRGQK